MDTTEELEESKRQWKRVIASLTYKKPKIMCKEKTRAEKFLTDVSYRATDSPYFTVPRRNVHYKDMDIQLTISLDNSRYRVDSWWNDTIRYDRLAGNKVSFNTYDEAVDFATECHKEYYNMYGPEAVEASKNKCECCCCCCKCKTC